MPTNFPAPFTPDWAAILGRAAASRERIEIHGVGGRTVVVTGAGGFIGSGMVRLLAASGAEKVILLEIAEQALFGIVAEMTSGGFGDRCIPVVGSFCDDGLLRAILHEHRPDTILHAAALKHVPLMELNPFAAIATNSIGTWTLAQAAAACGVSRFILVSTDKAVAPHSIMGASKRIAELAALAHGFTAVRLVNVLGSPGSVGPIFAEQVARGGPVTVTDQAARRFFLTRDEVARLLCEAMEKEEAPGLLVPDAGEAILIGELARRIINKSGRFAEEPPQVPIVLTGLRPGDKLDESLLGAEERLGASVSPGLHRVHGPAAPSPEASLLALESAITARDLPLLLRTVERLVPDYQPSALLREAAGVASR